MARTPVSVPQHFVVDGSNIGTEGRSLPSLQQLNEAVMAFIDDHPDALITVVVDATFGHRIDAKEVAAFDEAVANNELVTPPAGAVGRGDAFVLQIAHKANAGILSNDSFQEFHGDYEWLFDDGRLIGGKPVPHVGWVFVERLPVRGPKSRMAVKEAKGGRRRSPAAGTSSGSPLATQPMPVPKTPPPSPAAAKPSRSRPASGSASASPKVVAESAPRTEAPVVSGSKSSVNELMPFLEFVERHPVGTSCTVVVESYASHGAYARSGDVLVYLPLRLMGDPAPRSARSAVAIGEALAVVIAGYVPDRRSVDAALPSAASTAVAEAATDGRSEPAKKPARGRTRRAKATVEAATDPTTPDSTAVASSVAASSGSAPEPDKPAPKRRRAKPQATAPETPVVDPEPHPAPDSPPVKAATRRRAAKPSAPEPAPTAVATKRAPAKRGAPNHSKQSVAKQSVAKPAAATTVTKQATRQATKQATKRVAKPAAAPPVAPPARKAAAKQPTANPTARATRAKKGKASSAASEA